MIPHAMLALVLLVHLAPEHLAELLGHSQAAWAYVAYGIEAAVLWVLVAVVFRSPAIRAIGAFGAMEGAQRAACRLTAGARGEYLVQADPAALEGHGTASQVEPVGAE